LAEKISNPKTTKKNPFETFVRENSAFEILKEEVKKFLGEYNISMYTKDNPQGNLTVSHYMTLLQKLTSVINLELMRVYFKLSENYDFILDPLSKKKTNAQKEYKEYISQDM
jgi:flagellin-specific chaperone FliS